MKYFDLFIHGFVATIELSAILLGILAFFAVVGLAIALIETLHDLWRRQ